MSYILVEYGKDQNSYTTYADCNVVEKAFMAKVESIGRAEKDPLIIDNDDLKDTLETLAEGQVYCINDEIRIEIIKANDGGILDEQAKEDLVEMVENGVDVDEFYAVLACIGCCEEFDDYKDSMENEEEEEEKYIRILLKNPSKGQMNALASFMDGCGIDYDEV